MTEILSPADSDLRPFKDRGGKLLMYHGWSDPAISAYGTLDYYEEVVKKVGGQREADTFARLYLVPGMHHCAGGPGPSAFDMIPVLENWVERGVTPGRVVASHSTDGRVDRTRPLCPHPQVARYGGSGSADDAANFTCQNN
jgi:feruloyl esterase